MSPQLRPLERRATHPSRANPKSRRSGNAAQPNRTDTTLLDAELALRSTNDLAELDQLAAAWIGRSAHAELVVVLVRSSLGRFIARAASPAVSVDRFGDVRRIEAAVNRASAVAQGMAFVRNEVCVWVEGMGTASSSTRPDRSMIDRLVDAYAFARDARTTTAAKLLRAARPKYRWWRTVVVVALLCLPVRLTAIVAAEVVPNDPLIVAAPFDGVVRSVLVKPQQDVKADEPMVEFDDRDLRERHDMAIGQLALARAKHGRLERGASRDPAMRADLSVAAAELALAEVEASAAERRVSRSILTADMPGRALVSDPTEWAGRAVRTGERILSVADPSSVYLHLPVPSPDAHLLADGALIRFFPDGAPLAVESASLERVASVADVDQNGVHKRDAFAAFDDPTAMQIGQRGSAAISGPRVPLFYALLRKPVAALRQWIGW